MYLYIYIYFFIYLYIYIYFYIYIYMYMYILLTDLHPSLTHFFDFHPLPSLVNLAYPLPFWLKTCVVSRRSSSSHPHDLTSIFRPTLLKRKCQRRRRSTRMTSANIATSIHVYTFYIIYVFARSAEP